MSTNEITKRMLGKARRAYKKAGYVSGEITEEDLRKFCIRLLEAGLNPAYETSARLRHYVPSKSEPGLDSLSEIQRLHREVIAECARAGITLDEFFRALLEAAEAANEEARRKATEAAK